ncbi:MAG: GNAT family N-acetyltransferase [Bacteroidota bacterium]|nr:GNAT family N-acetyltransferase [Bacteroidota bacterium]MDP4232490.1 GNAT family N-acetyltransferase [Bacteroidota bacterium]MDP4241625.1 GNAT family N-acetyltransferase [Bacteroidota bacterium]MDP4286369.1 GNAT family N-acetyltransferase [Bacteroidota bacterium]
MSLRKYTQDDVPLLHVITSDAATMSFYPAPFTIEQTAAWIERSMKSYDEHGFGRYATFLKRTGEYIGCVGYFRTMVNDVMENDLGYIIARDHSNKGYATEAAKACLDLAEREKWFCGVVIQMAHDHIASRRVAEHLGATLEATFINRRNRDILTNLFLINLE